MKPRRLGPYGICCVCKQPNALQAVQFRGGKSWFVHQGACAKELERVFDAAMTVYLATGMLAGERLQRSPRVTRPAGPQGSLGL